MLTALRKSFSRVINQAFKATMASNARYFLNKKPDYEFEFGPPEVNINDIKNSLNVIIKNILINYKPTLKHGGEGLYLGTAGVAYMFYHLSKIPTLSEYREEYLNNALEYLKPAIAVATVNKSKEEIPSFLLGNCGIYAVAAAIYKTVGDESQSEEFRELYYKAGDFCADPHFLSCGSDELFVGRAGYILGALWLANETGTEPVYNRIHPLLKSTIQSGREYAKRHHSRCPLMYAYYQVEYIGAAHGLSSILQAILSVPKYLKSDPSTTADVWRCVDYILHIQCPDGNFPATTDEVGHPCELIHWCHGAAGVVYLMAKAYIASHGKETKYLDSCRRMADLIWEKGLLKKGPGICHGVAGNGYVFLLMHRLTKEPKYLYRAVEFYKFMNTKQFDTGARTPDYPYSLYEGLAGTACFLADLTSAGQASFPFSDVFQ